MRVIGGTHRSRPLIAPPDAAVTRPITDRVKEALFNRLMSLNQLGAGNVLDIFAGTGSMGIEALSRGADHCTFIERNNRIAKLLRRNLQDLGFESRATLLTVDAFISLGPVLAHRPIDLVFCDPPYPVMQDERDRTRIVRMLEALPDLDPDAAVVLRTPRELDPPDIAPLDLAESAIYGTTRLHIYTPAAS